MVWNLLIETQAREPSPSQMHAQLFHQLALAGDTVHISAKCAAGQLIDLLRSPKIVLKNEVASEVSDAARKFRFQFWRPDSHPVYL